MRRLGNALGLSIHELGSQILDVVQESSTSATASKHSSAKIIHDLRELQASLRLGAKQLQKIRPPAKVKVQQALLLRGVREYASELNGVIATVKAGQTQAGLSLIYNLKGIKDMTTASHAITAKGFAIGQ